MTFPRKQTDASQWLMRTLSLAVLIAAWHLAARAVDAPLILPAPLAVAGRLCALARTADFWRHLAATALRALKSAVIVLCAGSAFGVLCGMSRRFAAFASFPLAVIRSTPVVSFILLALFWLGTDEVPVFCAVLMAFPLMVTAVATGVAQRDDKLLAMARVFRLTRFHVARHVYAEAVLPFFASGARASFGMIWKVVAASEVLSVPRRALGTLMQTAQVHLETADVLAVSVVLVLLGMLTEAAARLSVRAFRAVRRIGITRCMGMPKLPFCGGLFRGARCFREAAGSDALPKPAAPVRTEARPVSVRGLSVSYGGVPVLADFSLFVAAGEVLAVLAPSGAGKTTLLDHIAAGAWRVSYAFQEPRLLDSCTILRNVALPLERTMSRAQAVSRAAAFLRQVGLGDRMAAFPRDLSGGEQQRVALARALAVPADVLLLDEAFRSQDAHGKAALIAFVKDCLRREPRTVLLVTHDLHEAVALATRVIVCAARPLRVTSDSGSGGVPSEAALAALLMP